MPLPHNLYDYCSIRISSLVEKYLVVKRKISFVDKADILLTKLIIRGGIEMIESFVNIESASQLAGNVPFQNFVQGDERVTSWSETQDGHDCAITVRCKNMSALEELTKELKDKCDILNVSHNVIVSQ